MIPRVLLVLAVLFVNKTATADDCVCDCGEDKCVVTRASNLYCGPSREDSPKCIISSYFDSFDDTLAAIEAAQQAAAMWNDLEDTELVLRELSNGNIPVLKISNTALAPLKIGLAAESARVLQKRVRPVMKVLLAPDTRRLLCDSLKANDWRLVGFSQTADLLVVLAFGLHDGIRAVSAGTYCGGVAPSLHPDAEKDVCLKSVDLDSIMALEDLSEALRGRKIGKRCACELQLAQVSQFQLAMRWWKSSANKVRSCTDRHTRSVLELVQGGSSGLAAFDRIKDGIQDLNGLVTGLRERTDTGIVSNISLADAVLQSLVNGDTAKTSAYRCGETALRDVVTACIANKKSCDAHDAASALSASLNAHCP